MKLLNLKSILECNEIEEELHQNEINTIIDNIYKLNDFNCVLAVTDSFNNEPKIYKSKLHEVLDYLEYFDIKNGIDVYEDDDFLTFVLNGQTYEKNGVINIYQTFFKILILDVNGNPTKVRFGQFR